MNGNRAGAPLLAAALVATLAGCADQAPPQPVGPLPAVSGFFDVEPVAFSFRRDGAELAFLSEPARLFYSFHPAAEDPVDRPLFVFFNGGPGCPTSDALLASNTGPVTLDPSYNGGRKIGTSTVSWTRLGNLLHVDARMTGFSYGLLRDPADDAARSAAFGAQNFNPYLDAADVVRLLLRFLAAHPALQDNPVVLVGESYGGVRATLMLHMLLHPERHAGGGASLYRDDALVAEIDAHFATALAAPSSDRRLADVAARQFGHQVLIQPLLSGEAQDQAAGALFAEPDSIIHRIASETGLSWTPCEPAADPECSLYGDALDFVVEEARRDVYAYTEPDGYLLAVFESYGQAIVDPGILQTLLQVDVDAIANLGSSSRALAFRFPGPSTGSSRAAPRASSLAPGPPLPAMARALARMPLLPARARQGDRSAIASPGDTSDVAAAPLAFDERRMASAFGVLRSWDRYFLSCQQPITRAFYENAAVAAGFPVDPFDDHFGDLFLENLLHVQTFVTDAQLDLVVYSAAIPRALATHEDVVASVEPTRWPGDEPRPGALEVRFRAGAAAEPPELRTIRFPRYENSGHGVEAFEPDALRDDVGRWMARVAPPH